MVIDIDLIGALFPNLVVFDHQDCVLKNGFFEIDLEPKFVILFCEHRIVCHITRLVASLIIIQVNVRRSSFTIRPAVEIL